MARKIEIKEWDASLRFAWKKSFDDIDPCTTFYNRNANEQTKHLKNYVIGVQLKHLSPNINSKWFGRIKKPLNLTWTPILCYACVSVCRLLPLPPSPFHIQICFLYIHFKLLQHKTALKSFHVEFSKISFRKLAQKFAATPSRPKHRRIFEKYFIKFNFFFFARFFELKSMAHPTNMLM